MKCTVKVRTVRVNISYPSTPISHEHELMKYKTSFGTYYLTQR